VYKQAIAMFLAETLVQVVREEDKNPELFSFVETALIWLDNHDSYADFHLLFLLRLTRFLGFFPDNKNVAYKYFDMEEACFSQQRPAGRLLEGDKLILFRKLIGINFDGLEQLKWNSEKRQMLLMELMRFYELHLPGFRLPNSLKVLKEVFNEIS
jgi:DNA repair protein RecO (recombination protein O)